MKQTQFLILMVLLVGDMLITTVGIIKKTSSESKNVTTILAQSGVGDTPLVIPASEEKLPQQKVQLWFSIIAAVMLFLAALWIFSIVRKYNRKQEVFQRQSIEMLQILTGEKESRFSQRILQIREENQKQKKRDQELLVSLFYHREDSYYEHSDPEFLATVAVERIVTFVGEQRNPAYILMIFKNWGLTHSGIKDFPSEWKDEFIKQMLNHIMRKHIKLSLWIENLGPAKEREFETLKAETVLGATLFTFPLENTATPVAEVTPPVVVPPTGHEKYMPK